MRSRALVLVATLLLPCTLVAQDAAVTSWIRSNAVPLKTVEARNGFADMQGLRQIIGNARIVSLGEATHGTREFFQLKHRMLEFLANEMGFTIFSIEANMPEAYRLNDYVLNGTGDPAALLRGMYFWTWNTEEVLDMIKWMREFNASGKGRVQFTGFDMQASAIAGEIVQEYVARAEPGYAATVRDGISMMQQPPLPKWSPGGVMIANIPAAEVIGKRVRVSGYIKTEDITNGFAGFIIRSDAGQGVAFAGMDSTGPRGTTPWKHYQIDLGIPLIARNLTVGAVHPGNGTAWIADMKVEIDGKVYEKLPFDLSMWPARGYSTSGWGYRFNADKDQSYEGKPSMRIDRFSDAPDPNPRYGDQAEGVRVWQQIYDHLKANSAGSANRRWAAQNARVVLQSLLMRKGDVTRDQSMADNVKWILDENPNAKIVLWAHNGHVTAQAVDRIGMERPMGASLREMFGSQMVVFGFAFNQGSFQAVKQPTGLQQFTVGPYEPGSLDATLASAGLPIFALDMRKAPATGPVGTWINQPHRSRWIGAVFDEGAPQRLTATIIAPKAFDAILFVDKTTAARGNKPR